MAIYLSKYHRRNILLNKISKDINAHFGYKNGIPRVNLGPCGSFAKLFYFAWNERFDDKVNIAFLFSTERICLHCFINLPDGKCFDGGNGVITQKQLLNMYPKNSIIENMMFYREEVLERNADGTNRIYENCQNYDAKTVTEIITAYLEKLRL